MARHGIQAGRAALVNARHSTQAGPATLANARHGIQAGQAAAVMARHGTHAGRAALIANRHSVLAGPAAALANRHGARFGSATPAAARHGCTATAAATVRAHHGATAAGRAATAARHGNRARLDATVWTRWRHGVRASLPDVEIQIIQGPNHLIHAGRTYAIGDGTSLSCDDGSPLWLADIVLTTAADYGAIQIGDALTLWLWGSPVSLICDERQMRRSASGAPSYTIKALSPLALRGAPWHPPIMLGTVGMARATVARILDQAVTWTLPDWPLPATAAALEGTPLDLARQIVGAVGGRLESAPDGTLRARPATPAPVPNWATADATALTDRDLLGHADSIGSGARINRLVITSGDSAGQSAQIQIAATADPDDPLTQTVRAWPWPWRPLELVHTGDGTTAVSAPTETLTAHTEQLTIAAGEASTERPVSTLIASHYQHADLGAVTSDGPSVRTQTAGYSLLHLEYQARAWEWRVTHGRAEDILFLVVE
jgi:hypothetical protein